MQKDNFLDPSKADSNGICRVGGELSLPLLIEAYGLGIFPWPIEGYPIIWFSPDPRAVLFKNNFYQSRSYKKWLQKTTYIATSNRAFVDVLKLCQTVKRSDGSSSWLTDEYIKVYTEAFAAQLAYSIEVWKDDQLVAGMFGIRYSNYWTAESMFHLKPNASKLALDYGLSLCPFDFLDIQVLNPFTKKMGGLDLPRSEFLLLISKS